MNFFTLFNHGRLTHLVYSHSQFSENFSHFIYIPVFYLYVYITLYYIKEENPWVLTWVILVEVTHCMCKMLRLVSLNFDFAVDTYHINFLNPEWQRNLNIQYLENSFISCLSNLFFKCDDAAGYLFYVKLKPLTRFAAIRKTNFWTY